MPKVAVLFAAGASVFMITAFAQSRLPTPVRMVVNQLPTVGRANLIAEFRLSETGGNINLAPAHANDEVADKALVAYASLLQKQLGTGDTSALAAFAPAARQAFVRMKNIPAAAISVQQTPHGVLLNFAASDQESRIAIHDYIRIARGQPELTAEERALNHPGNNLGWDAQKSEDLGK